jgi:hypothetical protein
VNSHGSNQCDLVNRALWTGLPLHQLEDYLDLAENMERLRALDRSHRQPWHRLARIGRGALVGLAILITALVEKLPGLWQRS